VGAWFEVLVDRAVGNEALTLITEPDVRYREQRLRARRATIEELDGLDDRCLFDTDPHATFNVAITPQEHLSDAVCEVVHHVLCRD
jgi:hypothetical protein